MLKHDPNIDWMKFSVVQILTSVVIIMETVQMKRPAVTPMEDSLAPALRICTTHRRVQPTEE